MPVALGDVVNVDHECGIGANNCGEWSGTALGTTSYSLAKDLTHSVQGSQYMDCRVSITPDGSSMQCWERDPSTVALHHSGEENHLHEETRFDDVPLSFPDP